MRQNIDIEMIKRRTTEGQLEKIRQTKVKDAEERVRVPEMIETSKLPADAKVKTRNQMLERRRETNKSHKSHSFKLKAGIHQSIPNFYVKPSTTT